MPPLRKILKKPLLLALKNEWLRRKIVYELRKDFFCDFEMSIPLGEGLSCPLFRHDYVHSFSEIFVAGEYGGLLREIPLPRRWIDLGCHAGFFSLHMAWQCRRLGSIDFSALLLDADPRVAEGVLRLIELNALQNQFRFIGGMIGQGSGSKPFGLREVMGSSANLDTHAGEVARVPVIASDEIRKVFPPPWDLVKVDIEGGEFDLLENYGSVLAGARHLLIEWHSWDALGSGENRIREALAAREFRLEKVLQERKNFRTEGRDLTTGCHLYRNLAWRESAGERRQHAAA
jgi:FkbM family methyltransferase